MSNCYFSTLSEVRDAIARQLVAADAVLARPDYFSDSLNGFSSGVKYGETVAEHAELATLRGRTTRKFAHAVVYRLPDSGRYELTFYIL